MNWGALLQPGVQLEEWQREKLQETIGAMSYQLGSSAMPWLQVSPPSVPRCSTTTPPQLCCAIRLVRATTVHNVTLLVFAS